MHLPTYLSYLIFFAKESRLLTYIDAMGSGAGRGIGEGRLEEEEKGKGDIDRCPPPPPPPPPPPRIVTTVDTGVVAYS